LSGVFLILEELSEMSYTYILTQSTLYSCQILKLWFVATNLLYLIVLLCSMYPLLFLWKQIGGITFEAALVIEFESSRQMFENTQIRIFIKILLAGDELFRSDGRTDVRTDVT